MKDAGRLIRETNLVPKKEKGQNFLTDEGTADRQVNYAEISEGDGVLEIGPGFGILTGRLIETKGNLTCIELDDKLAEHIENKFGNRLTLIRGDAVKVDWPEFDVFVSNLPYSVSTPILFKLLEHDFKKAVIMVQKEFADRMVAKPGTKDYSRLTVGVYHKADCKILEKVPASKFNPRPKVDSAVVSLIPRSAPFELKDEKLFFRIVNLCFGQRRKKIGTVLKKAGIVKKDSELPYLDNRIEDLSPEEIGELANMIVADATNV